MCVGIKLPLNQMLKRLLSPLNCLHIFVKNTFTISMRVYFWTLYSVPLTYVSILMPVPYCLDYCSFLIILKLWGNCPPTLFFGKFFFAIIGLFNFYINFRISLSISGEESLAGNLIKLYWTYRSCEFSSLVH